MVARIVRAVRQAVASWRGVEPTPRPCPFCGQIENYCTACGSHRAGAYHAVSHREAGRVASAGTGKPT